jgi:L-fuconolactonase
MVSEADWNHWKHEDFEPYLDVVFEAFSSKRLMIGSDWPVCLTAGDYGSVMKIVQDYLVGFSKEDQDAVLGDNAKRFYRL